MEKILERPAKRVWVKTTIGEKNRPQDSTYIPDYLNAAVESPFSLVTSAHNGLSAEMINFVSAEMAMSQDELAELLNITPKTLRKYLNEDNSLDVSASELILKLHAMHKIGMDVFGDIKAFRQWLSQPAYGFDRKIPMVLLKSSEGINLVTDELHRIAFGDLS
ncbi:MAG: antitoxin Xre/MbcA/ParS toxin-binding domain-containing protein [Bacteroidota bacterium]